MGDAKSMRDCFTQYLELPVDENTDAQLHVIDVFDFMQNVELDWQTLLARFGVSNLGAYSGQLKLHQATKMLSAG